VTAVIATDNTHLILGSSEGFMQFWGLSNAECLVNFPRAHDFEIKGFVLSKDSRYLVSFDKAKIKVWDILARTMIKMIETEQQEFGFLSCSFDDKYLVATYTKGDVAILSLGSIRSLAPEFDSHNFMAVNVNTILDIKFHVEDMKSHSNSLIEAIAFSIKHKVYRCGTQHLKQEIIKDFQIEIVKESLKMKKPFQKKIEFSDEDLKMIETADYHQQQNILKLISRLHSVEFLIMRNQDNILMEDLVTDCKSPKSRIFLLLDFINRSQYSVLTAVVSKMCFTGFLPDDEQAHQEMLSAARKYFFPVQRCTSMVLN